MGKMNKNQREAIRWWIPSPSDWYLASQVKVKDQKAEAGSKTWWMPVPSDGSPMKFKGKRAGLVAPGLQKQEKVATHVSPALDFPKDSPAPNLLGGTAHWPSAVELQKDPLPVAFLLVLALYLHLILSRLRAGRRERDQTRLKNLLEKELRDSNATIASLEAQIQGYQQHNWEQELQESRSTIASLRAQVQSHKENGAAQWKEEKEALSKEMEKLQAKMKEQAEYLKQTLVMHDIPNAQYDLVETRAELQQERQRNKVLARGLEAWKSRATADKEQLQALRRMREIDLSMIASLTAQEKS